MGMVIKNNIDSVRTYNIYNRNTIALSNAMYKVSSGQRINSAADGASDLAISERLRSRIQATDQANRNAQNANSMMKVAEGALTNISDILARMHELAVEAANGNNSSSDYTLFGAEATSLVNQISQNITSAKFNGMALLNGDGDSLQFQLGDSASDLDSTLVLSSIDAEAPFGLDEYALSDQSTANAAISVVELAQDSVASYLANIGAYENQLGYTADNLATQSENLQAAESTIRDLDMAKGMTDFMKMNVLTQASQFMLAQAGQNAYSVLNLLQQ